MALADDVVNVAHTAAAKANALTAHRTPPTRMNRLCAVTPHLSDLDMTTPSVVGCATWLAAIAVSCDLPL